MQQLTSLPSSLTRAQGGVNDPPPRITPAPRVSRRRDPCRAKSSARVMPRSATSGCITWRLARGRWSCCCTGSPSSGTAGGCRSGRSRRRGSASWSPICAVTTCQRGRTASRPTTSASSTADISGLIHERGAQLALLAGYDWVERRLGHRDEPTPRSVDRLAILNAAHPRKLSQGLHHPGQLRRSWYFFFFDLPDLPEAVVRADGWRFFRHFLRDADPAFTREETERYIEAWSQPGAASGMINFYQVLGADPAQARRSADSPGPSAPPWSSGARVTATSAPSWPSPTTTTCPTWTASSGPAPGATGPSRRGRAGQPAAHRVLRALPASQGRLNVLEVTGAHATLATRQAGFTGLASGQVNLLAGRGAAPAGRLGLATRRPRDGDCR